MKTYEQYKSSGIEWIGEVPEHWGMKKLKHIAYNNPSNVDKKSKDDEESVLLCNYVDVYKNDFITKELVFMEATASRSQIKTFKLCKGDVLLTKDSESPFDIAVPALVKEEFENVICGYHLTHIKSINTLLIGEFLFRIFQANNYSQYFSTLARGITRYALNTASFSELPIALPPLQEQTAIATFLDTKTTAINQSIVDKENLINLLEEERKALINEAVTKGIEKSVKLKHSSIDWLGEIPEHWEVKKLFYCFDKISSGATPKSDNENYYTDGNINWLNTGDLNNTIISFTKKKVTREALKDYSALKIYPKGSIVIAMYGATIGKLGILNLETTTNQACCVMYENRNVETLFIFYCLIAGQTALINLSVGGGQPNISQETIKSFRIPVPQIEEQIKIVNYIETASQTIDIKTDTIKEEITLLKEYRQALIFEAVTGKIDVRV